MIDGQLQFEKVVPGLEIARGAYTELASTIHDEFMQAESLPWVASRYSNIYGIRDRKAALANYVGEHVPSLVQLLETPLLEDISGNSTAGLNKQPPHSAQREHCDGGVILPGVYIIQCSPNGMFDYRRQPESMDFKSVMNAQNSKLLGLPVSTGDVVRLTDPSLQHRGRNPSSATRFNIVVGHFDQYLGEE